MKLGNRLRQLRNDSNKTQGEIANLLNVSVGAVSSYERNERFPLPDVLERYTNIFGVSYDYLLGKTNTKNYTEDKITVNVYGRVPAGIPIEAIEDIEDTEELSLADFSPSKEYLGLIVDGDSMYPDYLKGDTIIVEVKPDCESGEDCVVYVNGYDATLKTVIKNDDGTITLKPKNPEYPPKTYGPGDEEIRILGIVKELRRKR